MNIGIFSDTYTPQVNGVVTVVRSLKTELEKLGHKAYVFTVKHPDAVEEENVFRFPSLHLPSEPQHRIGIVPELKIIKMVKPLNLDIIHSHTEFSLYIASRQVSRRLKIPQVHTLHTYYKDYLDYTMFLKRFFKRNFAACLRYILRSQKCIVAPSQKIKDFLLSIRYPNPIQVVPNGINLSVFYETPEDCEENSKIIRARFNIPADNKIIVFVGRLGMEKNVSTLLSNFAEIYRRRPDTTLLLAGDGPDRRPLEEHTAELGISRAVVFTGYLHWPGEIKSIYAAADLFMSASHSEVHPITFIEAMASSLPVVAAADESIQDMVINGENGYAVENDKLLWEKAVDVLARPNSKSVLGAASKRISKNYSLERFIDSMLAIYKLYGKN